MSIVDERPRAEIVARVLERIAEYRYYADEDEDGELIVIPDYGPTFPEREEFLSEQLDELEKMRDGSEVDDDDFALSENWSDVWTRRLLEQDPFSAEDREQLLPILEGSTYDEVITFLHTALTENLEEAERLLAVGRETIVETKANEDSRALDEGFRDEMHERLSSFHARRLSKQFPRIVDRAVNLALLTAEFEVPSKVKRYIEEASKCYLNGQWIACLMVCRSAIEFTVRDRLKARHSSELQNFEKSRNGDSLKYLIELAKELLPWQFKVALEDAQKVREAARRAVHDKPPDENECRDMFMLTRTAVHLLYTKPQDLARDHAN